MSDLKIREDFKSAGIYLYRLWGYGEVFDEYLVKWGDLTRLAYRSDVYRRSDPTEHALFHTLWGDGREIAEALKDLTQGFNSFRQYPSFTIYVKALEESRQLDVEFLKNRHPELDDICADPDVDSVIKHMIKLWRDQIYLMECVIETIPLLKKSSIYLNENGEMTMPSSENQNNVIFNGVHGGKINIGSTDNSKNYHIAGDAVFNEIKEAASKSIADAQDKKFILEALEKMQAAKGSANFSEYYKSFMQAAANHMAIFSPFLPALSSLL